MFVFSLFIITRFSHMRFYSTKPGIQAWHPSPASKPGIQARHPSLASKHGLENLGSIPYHICCA